jgi:hypothetical protein
MEWIAANLEPILLALLGTQALATLIVNLTPTPRDDTVVGAVYRGIEIVAGIVTGKAKQVAPNKAPAESSSFSVDLPDINVRF